MKIKKIKKKEELEEISTATGVVGHVSSIGSRPPRDGKDKRMKQKDEITETFGIEHSTPQALCIKDGKVVKVLKEYDIIENNIIEVFS